MPDNQVTLTGNATRDVDLTFLSSGQGIAKFGLAVNSRKKVGDEYEDVPHFFDVTAFGSLAENIAETISKGTRVIVSGRLNYSTWDDKESGDKRSKVDLVADSIGPDLRWATATITKNEKPS